jgi:hypothetical protein
VGYNADL